MIAPYRPLQERFAPPFTVLDGGLKDNVYLAGGHSIAATANRRLVRRRKWSGVCRPAALNSPP